MGAENFFNYKSQKFYLFVGACSPIASEVRFEDHDWIEHPGLTPIMRGSVWQELDNDVSSRSSVSTDIFAQVAQGDSTLLAALRCFPLIESSSIVID
jgi:hypothetical protein